MSACSHLIVSPLDSGSCRSRVFALPIEGREPGSTFRRPRLRSDFRKTMGQVQATDTTEAQIAVARKFYEGAWSSSDPGELDRIIDDVIAEDHVQEDKIWQGQARHGRESIRKGIKFIRQWYPDARFRIDQAALTNDGGQVFVKWTMTGTYQGDHDTSNGLSLLTVNNGQISRTEVYRQALKAEADAANRSQGSQSGPFDQAAVLRSASSKNNNNE